MSEPEDHQWLAEFAGTGSEPAFAALVARYVNLVYSTALRSTGNPHSAQEITQAVFIILARKAGQLSPRVVLSGWLYQAARLTSANFIKGEIRRQRREQEVYMQSTLNEPPTEPTDAAWQAIAPLLDEAMGRLGQTDRDAVVLRFFENKSAAEIGTALRMSEETARRRVNRAVEKLRKIFARRGVDSSAAAISGAIAANSIQAAPPGLAKAVTAVAVVKGSVAAVSTLTLVKGTMKTMTWLKLKFALGAALALLVAGGAATLAVSQVAGGDRLSPQDIARQSAATYAALTSYADTGKVTTLGSGQTTETTFSIRLQRPNSYRIEWTQTGGSYTSKGVVWSDGTGNYYVMDSANRFAEAKPDKARDMQMALAMATGVSGSASSDIPGTFFNQNWGGQLKIFSSPRAHATTDPDEKIGDTDCHVIESRLDPVQLPNNGGTSGTVINRLWIGIQDHLIHQIQTTSEGASLHARFSDETLKTVLERQGKPVTAEAIAALRAKMEKDMQAAQGGKIVFTKTHENIQVNPGLTAADFAR